jgi:hypothetical protein
VVAEGHFGVAAAAAVGAGLGMDAFLD